MQQLIDNLEAAAMNAWPCLRQQLVAGWVVRIANGYTKRANSANWLYAQAELAPEHLIGQIEGAYQRHGLPPIIRIVERPETAQIDQYLGACGYRQIDRSLVLVADLPAQPVVAQQLGCAAIDPEQWLLAYSAFHGASPTAMQQHRQILDAILPATLYAAVHAEGQIAACGLAVLDRGYLGCFDIVTNPALRRRGYARHLMAGILAWGAEQGAHTAYLQVVEQNHAARSLYADLGFRQAYRYWYRIPALTIAP
ncbi:MAG: hypothetical protein Fur005_34500 [Roseiflexaceae bacterium]